MIELAQLIACGVAPTLARVFLEPVNTTLVRFEIDKTPQRTAMFIAQCAYESENFVHLEEDLFYTNPVRLVEVVFRSKFDLNRNRKADPEEIELAKQYVRNPKALANRVYANRLGNGDEASGDGWKYRGSGPLQLTGKDNFKAAGDAIGVDYVSNPDLVRQPKDGTLAAGWFWATARCNELMDDGLYDLVTRGINGPAMLGLDERNERYNRNLIELS